ncbi:MAG: RNA polymerase sigma factor [Gammaproteobacteria bacterium]|nr:RNA polymerase sigma factor [Gammaproteobacteria bacterium]
MRGTEALPQDIWHQLRLFLRGAHPIYRDMSKFADIQIDAAIVRRAARGDAKAHEIIYRAFSSPVYSVGLRFTRVPAHAEDLLQETFIEVMRSIGKFRGEAPLGSWIRRIAVSKALMFLRSAWHSRGQSLDDDWDDMTPGRAEDHGVSGRPDEAMDLDAALANLPEVSRAVVWLHDVEGFTHKEIAGLMGKTESFSKSQLSRAYQRLRPMLAASVSAGDIGLENEMIGQY